MMMRRRIMVLALTVALLVANLPVYGESLIWTTKVIKRPDGAVMYNKIDQEGSFECPTWGASSSEVLLTMSKGSYGSAYSNLCLMDTKTSRISVLTHEHNKRIESGNGLLYDTGRIFYTEISNGISQLRQLKSKVYATGLVVEAVELGDFPRSLDVGNPSLSPDGHKMAFDGASDKTRIDGSPIRQIYIMNDENDEVIQMTYDSTEKRRPRWSNDGLVLLYEQYDDQFRDWSLYVMDYSGKHHRRLTYSTGNETYGSFSPDGGWVVFSSDETMDGESLDKNKLFLISLYSGETLQLTEASFYDTMPCWSADGSRIVFQASPKEPSSYGLSWIAIVEAPDI